MDNEIQELIQAEKAKELAKIEFNKNVVQVKPTKPITSELIEHSLGQAIKHKVITDDKVQERLLNTADKVIDNAMNEAESEAETADKKAYFNNNKGACECWGYDEDTIDKRFVKLMSIIHSIFTTVWIAIGAITFAPIVFVAKKISVIVKKTWIATVIAILIYLAIILIPTLMAVIK